MTAYLIYIPGANKELHRAVYDKATKLGYWRQDFPDTRYEYVWLWADGEITMDGKENSSPDITFHEISPFDFLKLTQEDVEVKSYNDKISDSHKAYLKSDHFRELFKPDNRGEKGESVNDKKIIIELRKLAEFQQTYINYLLGSLNESEFMEYCENITGMVMSLNEIEKTIFEANND